MNASSFITKGTWFILGNGIQLDSDQIEILPYLKLNKINRLSVFELAGLGAQGFSQWALIEPYCYMQDNFEIISSENDISSGYDIVNRAWLLNTLLVLRKHSLINSIALLNRSWNNIEVVSNVKAQLLDYHVNMLTVDNKVSVLSHEDIGWLQVNFESANSLAFKYDKFRYALEVLNSFRYNADIRSAIAILWSAIESIVDITSEITFRLSLNISSLLYERGEERLSKFKEIKRQYNLRSKVVHGSNIKPNEASESLEGAFTILSDLIVYMIENQKLIDDKDFEVAIFG